MESTKRHRWRGSEWIDVLSDGDYRREFAQLCLIKRLTERLGADPDFRARVEVAPGEALSAAGIAAAPDQLAPLWQSDPREPLPEGFERFRRFTHERLNWPEMADDAGASTNPRFHAWRERQSARLAGQLTQPKARTIPHVAAAFELSKGCSVGCWFCGVGAPRLGDVFLYSDENARLWRDCLDAFEEQLGPAARSAFCYWATDPFDNPDYERFCLDFHDRIGLFPQTTTALALKDPARTRALLQLSTEHGCKFNRFSVLSLALLERVFAEFSAEELASVNLVTINKEASSFLTLAGRARNDQRRAAKVRATGDGTIACVSGFLINMVDRRVQLVSPCPASDRWPLGYMMFEEGRFESGAGLSALLAGMIERHMPLEVRPADRVAFRSDLTLEPLDEGFVLATRYARHRFERDPFLLDLAEIVRGGRGTAAELAIAMEMSGVPKERSYGVLNALAERGLLDETPLGE